MGQTLSHGVYLPAEGERNCYSGLASNWNLLDNAIGDIAGKASATHTHGSITNDGKLATANRVLITDGNKVISLSGVTDTELSYLSGVTSAIQTQLNAKAADSDVVHKSGNESIAGAKYWTYASRYLKPSDYVQATAFNVRTDPAETTGSDICRVWDGTNDSLDDYLGGMSFYQNTDGSTRLQFICFGYPTSGNAQQNRITFRAYRDGSTEFYPEINGNISFGKSDKRWKSIYADSYYYGTTAWGLDKANVWGNVNTISYSGVPELRIKHTVLNIASAPAENRGIQINFQDSAGNNVAGVKYIKGPDGTTRIFCELATKNSNNTLITKTLRLDTNQNGTDWRFYPGSNADIDLGTTDNKWKTLNGVNPGALSLPDYANAVNIDTTNWSLSDTMNVYTPTVSGWIQITIAGTSGNFIAILDSGTTALAGQQVSGTGSTRIYLTYPVIANHTYWIYVNAASIITARLLPCLGNV